MANKREEDILQAEIVKWYNNNYCLSTFEKRGIIFSVPNGGTRNKIEAMILKATGLLAGVSDLIVILPNSKILFIELKNEKGIQHEKQKDFENRINKLNLPYYLIRSLEQFKTIINDNIL